MSAQARPPFPSLHLVRLLIVAAIATTPLFSATGASAADDVSAELVPSSLTLVPGDAVTVDLVITNDTPKAVRIVRVNVLRPPHIRVQRMPVRTGRTIPAGGSLHRALRLRAESGLHDGELAILTQYRSKGSQALTRELAAALSITVGAGRQSPRVTFVSSPERINDGQARTAVVRLANPTPFNLEQITLFALDGDDVDVDLATPGKTPLAQCQKTRSTGSGRMIGCLAELRAGGSELIDLRLQAHDSVRTGKQRVGVLIIAGRGASGASADLPDAKATGTTDVDLAVFGVDALSPFGVGTLFLLPGLLAVVLFLLLARYIYPRRPGLPDTIELKDLRALPIVVPLAALVYVLVWLLNGRNLTETVGTCDIALIFALGMGLGLVAWGLIAAAWYRHSGRKQFLVGDRPKKVIKRLAAREASLSLPSLTVDGLNYRYLAPGTGGKLLVSPVLSYTFAEGVSDQRRAEFQQAVDKDDIKDVRSFVKAGDVSLKWQAGTSVRSVDEKGSQMQQLARLLSESQPL